MTHKPSHARNEPPADDALARRLGADADRLTDAPNGARVSRVMDEIRSAHRAGEPARRPAAQPAVVAHIGRLSPLAIAAAFILVAAPILFFAVNAPKSAPTNSPQQQAAALRSAFDAFDNLRLPDLPPHARESFSKALQLASPDAMKSQTKSLLEDGRRIAERFVIPIPTQLLPKKSDPPPPDDGAGEPSGVAAPPVNPSGAA